MTSESSASLQTEQKQIGLRLIIGLHAADQSFIVVKCMGLQSGPNTIRLTRLFCRTKERLSKSNNRSLTYVRSDAEKLNIS